MNEKNNYWYQLKDDFTSFLREKGYSQSSFTHYKGQIDLLIRFVNIMEYEEYTPEIGKRFWSLKHGCGNGIPKHSASNPQWSAVLMNIRTTDIILLSGSAFYTIENYLLDGRCEILNNRAERHAKSYGTRRKDFLFHNSVNGAKSSATTYSLVETAKVNHLNVFQYLYTLLLYTPDYKDKPAGVEAMMH